MTKQNMQILSGSLAKVREFLNALPDEGQWVQVTVYTETPSPDPQNFPVVRLDMNRISDKETFHTVFAEVLGFPDFYGRNMDAWIDCMTSLDEPSHGMTSIHAPAGGVLVLQLEAIDDFAARCPEQYKDLIECAAFVNWRRIENGGTAVLVLSFAKSV